MEWRVLYIFMPPGNIFFCRCLLGGEYVPCTRRVPGGVIVGDTARSVVVGLPVQCVTDVNCSSAINYFPLFVDLTDEE